MAQLLRDLTFPVKDLGLRLLVYNHLSFQNQGICCPLLATKRTCMPVVHVNSGRDMHMQIDKNKLI